MDTTWVVDITWSSADVKGIVSHIIRTADQEGRAAHVVIFAALEGVDGGSLDHLWQKFRKIKAEKQAQFPHSKTIVSLKFHVDSEILWEDGLLEALKTNTPSQLLVVMNSNTRRALLKHQDSLVVSEEVLLSSCQVVLLVQSRSSTGLKAERTDMPHLISGFRGLNLLKGSRPGAAQAPILEDPAMTHSFSSIQGPVKTTGRVFPPRASKADSSLASPRVSSRSHIPGSGSMSSLWHRSSHWLSGLRNPRESTLSLRRATVTAPPDPSPIQNRTTVQKEERPTLQHRGSRRSFVPSSAPLGDVPTPAIPHLSAAVEVDEVPASRPPSSGGPPRITRTDSSGSEDCASMPKLPSGKGAEDAEAFGRPARLARRKPGFVPQSAPLGAKVTPPKISVDDESPEDSSCIDHISRSSDESSRSRELSPRSHTGVSVCSWGSACAPGTPETPLLAKSFSKCREFSLDDLNAATDSFSDGNLLGKGTSGMVHKGAITGCPVAVKRINVSGVDGTEKFCRAVSLLSTIRHPNLVLLVGYCSLESAVVYEFMGGGTLAQTLKGVEPLKWYDRVRMASEIAGTVLYLHSQTPHVVHGDLRPENIFLDSCNRSKLCDVGLAQLLDRQDDGDEHWVNSRSLRYVDPRELLTGEITRQSDIYALGLVMLQLFMGEGDIRKVHKNLQAIHRDGATLAHKATLVMDLHDRSGGVWPAAVAEQMALLALECTMADPKPSLKDRVQPELQRLTEKVQLEQHRRRMERHQKLMCPLSKRSLKDPVIAADGCTYERRHIESWLQVNSTSPVTGKVLEHKILVPNLAIVNMH